MKACADCRYSAHVLGWGCYRPEFPKDPVSGRTIGSPCEDEREHSGPSRCGPEGVHFEPTLGARLIHLFTREDF